RRHTSLVSDWSSDVCSSDLPSASSLADVVVQIIAAPVRRDVTVDQVDVLIPVVIQVAELRPPTPPAKLDAEGARQVVELQVLARSPLARNTQIVALYQHTLFRDVADIDGDDAAIERESAHH